MLEVHIAIFRSCSCRILHQCRYCILLCHVDRIKPHIVPRLMNPGVLIHVEPSLKTNYLVYIIACVVAYCNGRRLAEIGTALCNSRISTTPGVPTFPSGGTGPSELVERRRLRESSSGW